MGNSYFQFKQFRIEQEFCSMKVSTDACILGAMTPVPEVGYILDIGSGTGLLALMLAQRSECEIDSVEIDMPSYLQAKSNFEGSSWGNRLHIFQSDIKNFSSHKKYDLIICNPPFYNKHLRSPSERKNMARHAGELSLENLFVVVKNFLGPHGIFSVLMPASQSKRLITLASQNNLHLQQEILIQTTATKPFIRSINVFSFSINDNYKSKSLTVQDVEGKYTDDYSQLMEPFYLHL